jgi:hypothetical protein
MRGEGEIADIVFRIQESEGKFNSRPSQYSDSFPQKEQLQISDSQTRKRCEIRGVSRSHHIRTRLCRDEQLAAPLAWESPAGIGESWFGFVTCTWALLGVGDDV